MCKPNGTLRWDICMGGWWAGYLVREFQVKQYNETVGVQRRVLWVETTKMTSWGSVTCIWSEVMSNFKMGIWLSVHSQQCWEEPRRFPHAHGVPAWLLRGSGRAVVLAWLTAVQKLYKLSVCVLATCISMAKLRNSKPTGYSKEFTN